MDALSYSAHAPRGLDLLLREALLALHCPATKLTSFDHHSAVVIALKTLPDMRVAVVDDRLWIWSCLPGVTEAQVMHAAAAVLALLLQPIDGVACGQLNLGRGASGYELKALLDADTLRRKGLQAVLGQFYQRLADFCQILDVRK
ncbi:MAG: hypothetical protein JO171_02860 [Paludibacterium sp.]|nr:hypothetical protein [Paludibacterium sp.]MBV8046065.1 hypothetical protein [Paludibacterium sp.]MBV8646154.1 hypothetical protein [Paludibacterium sp.]